MKFRTASAPRERTFEVPRLLAWYQTNYDVLFSHFVCFGIPAHANSSARQQHDVKGLLELYANLLFDCASGTPGDMRAISKLCLKMNRPWLRAAQKLQFRDPHSFLVKLRKLEIEIALSDTPSRIKSLRTNGLKEARERREAALFCKGMSERLGQTVYFASHEDQDFDFVASWVIGDSQHFAPVQLKEVVPTALNSSATLESVIDGLEKYTDSSDLTVAIHLNQVGRFDPDALRLQHLKLGSVWVFAAATVDQSLWNLWGNFTEDSPYGNQFSYPAVA